MNQFWLCQLFPATPDPNTRLLLLLQPLSATASPAIPVVCKCRGENSASPAIFVCTCASHSVFPSSLPLPFPSLLTPISTLASVCRQGVDPLALLPITFSSQAHPAHTLRLDVCARPNEVLANNETLNHYTITPERFFKSKSKGQLSQSW